MWEHRLAEVEDDMETRLLRAQQAELPFTLHVPDKVRAGAGLEACDARALQAAAAVCDHASRRRS